jgi:hypothetical protein
MDDQAKRLWRLAIVNWALAVFLAVLMLAGAGGSEKVVRATRFEVVDAKGKVVGSFGTDKDGTVLGVMDRTSRQGAMLGTRADGTAFVAVGAAAGHPNAGLVGAAGAGPTLVVTGKDGKPVWSAP